MEFSQAFTSKEAPDVSDKYLRSFVEGDSFALNQAFIAEWGELGGDQFQELEGTLVALPDAVCEWASKLLIKDSPGFVEVPDPVLYQGDFAARAWCEYFLDVLFGYAGVEFGGSYGYAGLEF